MFDNRIALDYIQDLRRVFNPPAVPVTVWAATGVIRGWVPGACPWDGWWVDFPDLGEGARLELRADVAGSRH